MTNIDLIKRSGRHLRQSKLRSFLTMAAISVGAFALALTLAIGQGGRDFIGRLINTNVDPQQVFITLRNNSGQSADTPQKYDPNRHSASDQGFAQLTAKDVDAVKRISGLNHVRGTVQPQIEYVRSQTSDKYEAGLELFPEFHPPKVAAGNDSTLNDSQIVIPEKFVSPLGFDNNQAAIGKTVTLGFLNDAEKAVEKSYTVAAVGAKGNGILGGVNQFMLNENAFDALYHAQKGDTAASDTFFGITARLDNVNDKAQTDQIKKELSSKGYKVQTAEDLASTVFQIITALQIGLGVFAAIALLVSVFGIVNTQFISVLERTREIGLLKALGMKRNEVARLFIYESAWIGLLGGLIGVGAAVLVGIAANHIIPHYLDWLGGNALEFNWLGMGVLILSLVIIATIAGLLPALKASRLDPIAALRTE